MKKINHVIFDVVNGGLEMRHEGEEDVYRFDPEQSLALLDLLAEHRTDFQKAQHPNQAEPTTDGHE